MQGGEILSDDRGGVRGRGWGKTGDRLLRALPTRHAPRQPAAPHTQVREVFRVFLNQ